MYGNTRTEYPSNFWSSKYNFTPEQKQEISVVEDDEETPYHQEKKAIIETRAKLVKGENKRTKRTCNTWHEVIKKDA